MEKYELIHLDTCLSDYFSGHHKPVLAVIVYGSMTASEFVDAVVDEYMAVWDHLTMEWYDGDDKDDKAWPNLQGDEIRAMAADMLTVSGDDPVFPELDDPTTDELDDWIDPVVCHITIERV